jgi:hypothetical protein
MRSPQANTRLFLRTEREAENVMRSGLLANFVSDFPWFHRWMGLIGNALFVIGSVFFLYQRLVMPGTWIFIGASLGMLIDSAGEKLLRREQERRGVSPARVGADA